MTRYAYWNMKVVKATKCFLVESVACSKALGRGWGSGHGIGEWPGDRRVVTKVLGVIGEESGTAVLLDGHDVILLPQLVMLISIDKGCFQP